MNPAEPPVFTRLKNALDDAGVPYRHLHHPPVRTSEEAAAVRGTPLCSGAKALILKGDDGFVMAVIPADRTLHGASFRRCIGSRRLRFATKEELHALTGLTPGAVPPFGSLFGLRTISDRRLADNERINFNAGSHEDSLQIAYEDWLRYESPQVAAITRET